MQILPRQLPPLIWQTIVDPAGMARRVVALQLTRVVLWQSLALVTVLGVLLAALTQGPAVDLPATEAPLVVTPWTYALLLGSSLVFLVFALVFAGQALGGTGDMGAALALVIWLEVLAMAIRLVQAAVLLVAPGLAGPVSLFGIGVLLWCLVNFINVLHGFENRGKAALVLVLSVIGISLGVALVLTLIGVGTVGGNFDV